MAAAFNTPLAGIVFAIEEMGRAFEQRNAGLVLIAVILAGMASLGLVGNYDYFGSNNSMLIVTIDWIAVFICGLAGGVAGALFAKLVLRISRWSQTWIAQAPMPPCPSVCRRLRPDRGAVRAGQRRRHLWHRL